MEKSSNDSTLLANMVVLAILKGEEYEKPLEYVLYQNSASIVDTHTIILIYPRLTSTKLFSDLKAVAPEHELLTSLEEKSELFDKAASKYAAKISA